MLAPFVIQLKVILQNLWKRGQTWDQAVPDDLRPRINKLATQYATMPDISVPRQISPLLTSAELHIFIDASISAFSGVIYARQPPSDTTPARLVFVLGKSRVAPIKQRSVPKLELEASVLEVRLLRTVLNAFECNFRQVLFWTDSCVVLDWIQNQKKLKHSLLTEWTKSLNTQNRTSGTTFQPNWTRPITELAVWNPQTFPPNGQKDLIFFQGCKKLVLKNARKPR